MADKEKENTDLRSSSVWDDTSLALMKAQDAFTVEELKVFLGIPSNEIVGRHIYKLVQVIYLYYSFFFFLILCMDLKVWCFT